jgi:hypothetical protein
LRHLSHAFDPGHLSELVPAAGGRLPSPAAGIIAGRTRSSDGSGRPLARVLVLVWPRALVLRPLTRGWPPAARVDSRHGLRLA